MINWYDMEEQRREDNIFSMLKSFIKKFIPLWRSFGMDPVIMDLV